MKWWNRVLDDICRVYTLTALLLLLLRLAMAGSFDNTVIRPGAFLLILPFSAGVALAAALYRWQTVSHALRLTGHFVICVLCAFLFLYLPYAASSGASGKLLALLGLCLLYWALMGIYLALTAKRRAAQRTGSEYRSVFKK